MHLRSCFFTLALLGQLSLFARGLPIETLRSDVSINSYSKDDSVPHAIEARAFVKLKNYNNERFHQLREKNKDKNAPTRDIPDGEASEAPVELRSPPPKYVGDPPPGMTEGRELQAWNEFIELEASTGHNPPVKGGYLMYSGDTLRDYRARQLAKDTMEATDTGKLHDWDDTYGDTPAYGMWFRYQTNVDPSKEHIPAYALSWGQARRAANDQEDLYILFEKRTDPLMKSNTYWGAIEAGIITGPDSKVQRIYRLNNDDLQSGQNTEADLVWMRDTHQPFGRTTNDWRVNPKIPENPADVEILQSAVPIGL